MFNDELGGLPPALQEALRARLEEVVRLIYQNHNTSLRDVHYRHYTKEELSAMIYGVFDLAQRLKTGL